MKPAIILILVSLGLAVLIGQQLIINDLRSELKEYKEGRKGARRIPSTPVPPMEKLGPKGIFDCKLKWIDGQLHVGCDPEGVVWRPLEDMIWLR